MNAETMRAKGYIEVPGKGWQKVPASKLDGDAVQLQEIEPKNLYAECAMKIL